MKRGAGKRGKARAILTRALLAAAIAFALALAGCVDAHPVVTTATIPPDPTPTPTPTPSPTPEPTPTPTPTPGVVLDALGAVVNDAAHYEKYITFRNIAVYEQEDDTFIDLIAVNSYPESMICALGAVFYDDTGELAASAQLQTRDGEYLLTLASGETTLYARVDTDTPLTMMDISLVFDESVGVYPEK